MRYLTLLLALILFATLPALAGGDELMSNVPLNDLTYTQMRQLDRWDILSDGQDKLREESRQPVLTRYDMAFLLVEPLERCVAFVAMQETPTSVLPEQRRRAEIAYLALSKLSPTDFDQMLVIMSQLAKTFASDIDQLSPGMSARATTALRKLTLPHFRPWTPAKGTSDVPTPVIHLSINPHVQQSTATGFLNLSFLSPTQGGRTNLFTTRIPRVAAPSTSGSGDASEAAIVGSRAVSSLEAAVDVAFGRFRLYGSLATLPGQPPMLTIIKPEGSGKAMLGMEVDLVRIKNLGISGIFEYHIMRSGEPANYDINTGAVGGIGLNW
ncbi:MAG TPA: hypothetical protein VGL77_15380 [Armatimonadota bacterium]|jgi:hypothetical protein